VLSENIITCNFNNPSKVSDYEISLPLGSYRVKIKNFGVSTYV